MLLPVKNHIEQPAAFANRQSGAARAQFEQGEQLTSLPEGQIHIRCL